MSQTAIVLPAAAEHDRHFRTDHLMADLKGRSVRGGAVTLTAQGIKFLLQIGSTAVLARLLAPGDFGLVAMVSAFTGFIALFKDLGLSMATVQRAEITHQQVSTLFWINVVASVVLMVVAAALAPAVAWFYGEPRLTGIMLVIAGTFLFGGLTAQHSALLQRHMRFSLLAAADLLSLAAGVAVGIAMAWRGFSYWSLVGMTAATAAANTLFVWLFSPWRPGLPRRGAGTSAMLRFGGHLTGFNVLNYFTCNFDNILIGATLGAGPLGIYAKAYNLLGLPIRQINGPMGAVALPALSRLQSDPQGYRRYYLRAVEIIAFAGMPIAAFAFVAADEVVLLLLGPQWTAAVPVFRWLAPAAFLGTLNVVPGWLCVSLGHTERQVHWALAAAPITVGAFVVGLRWGIEGVAAAFSLTWCLLLIAFMAYACWSTPVRLRDIRLAVWRPAAACGVAGCLVAGIRASWATDEASLIAFLTHGVLFALGFAGAILLLPAGPRTVRRLIGDVRSHSVRRAVNP